MSADTPEWAAALETDSHRQCRNCGSHIQTQTARVFGDENDDLWHCHNCENITQRDMKAGAGRDPDYDPRTDRLATGSSGRNPIFHDGGDR